MEFAFSQLIGKVVPYVIIVLLTTAVVAQLGREAKERAVERAYVNCEKRCNCDGIDPRKRRWLEWLFGNRQTPPPASWERLFGPPVKSPFPETFDNIPESLNPFPEPTPKVPILMPSEGQHGEEEETH